MRVRSRHLGPLLFVAVVCAGGASAQEGASLDSTRATVSKWVETQQIISKEREEWQLAREVLQQRIKLIEGEIASLERKIAELQTGIDEADTKQRDLGAENTGLKQATSTLGGIIGPLESKTQRLVAQLPNPIRERISPLSQRIPDDPAKTQLSLSERFQNVIGILNEVNKFNRDITVTSEIRPLADGSTAEVKALYLGLGQAYFVTPDGRAAGVGRPTAEGWEWSEANQLAPRVLEAIAILQNESVPDYVALPVEIR
jgi:hypothetical protein